MIFPSEELSDLDRTQLAVLHKLTLNGSLLGLFETGVVKAYYDFVVGSDTEVVFVERTDRITGAAVLSLDPSTLMARLIKKNMFSARFGFTAFKSPNAVIAALKSIFTAALTSPHTQGLPEVVQLFSSPERRGQGVGSSLLTRAETFLRGKNRQRYYVKTDGDPNNPALAFYKKRGFYPLDMRRANGKSLAFLVRDI